MHVITKDVETVRASKTKYVRQHAQLRCSAMHVQPVGCAMNWDTNTTFRTRSPRTVTISSQSEPDHKQSTRNAQSGQLHGSAWISKTQRLPQLNMIARSLNVRGKHTTTIEQWCEQIEYEPCYNESPNHRT